jgi:hypothetical protein
MDDNKIKYDSIHKVWITNEWKNDNQFKWMNWNKVRMNENEWIQFKLENVHESFI